MGGGFGENRARAPPGDGVDERVQTFSADLEELPGPGRERLRHVPLLVADQVLQ